MATQVTLPQKDGELIEVQLEPAVHRRILNFLNEAIRPEDLVYEKLPPPNPEVNPIHEDNPEELQPKRKKFWILKWRKRSLNSGTRNIRSDSAI